MAGGAGPASPDPFHPATSEAEAANRLSAALDAAQAVTRLVGCGRRRFYGPLMRWYGAQTGKPTIGPRPRLWRHLGTCEYEMGLYPEWEQSLTWAGLIPARPTEQALRWDQVTASNSGREYEVLTEHQASLDGKKTAGLPSNP